MSLLANSNAIETGGYQISRSVRLRSSASAYLNQTSVTPTLGTKCTYSVWVKRGVLTSQLMSLLDADQNGAGASYDEIGFGASGSNDKIYIYMQGAATNYETTALFRDPSAWYHILCVVDSTISSPAADRLKLFVNGVQITSFTAQTTLSQNYIPQWQVNGRPRYIGRRYNGSPYFDGYLTEINFIDGQALTPSSFGETDTITGSWVAKKYTGTYGTNGFYLNFSDNSAATSTTIGKDYSGNGNNWTPNNISVTAGSTYDSMLDVPSGNGYADGGNGRGNYCTLNPLKTGSYSTLSNGNLTLTGNSATNSGASVGSISVTSGKWYWELVATTVVTTANGVGATTVNLTSQSLNDAEAYATNYGFKVRSSGAKEGIAGEIQTFTMPSFTSGDVIGIAVDADNGAIYVSKNNTWVNSGVPTSGLSRTGSCYNYTPSSDRPIAPLFSVYYSGSGDVANSNFGQRPFSYTPPTGFKALCTSNLPAVTGAAQQPKKHFDVVTRNGTSAAANITGYQFAPDFVWIKARNIAYSNVLSNVLTGATKFMQSNTTAAEQTDVQALTAFNSDGYSLGTWVEFNETGKTYVDWAWKANGTGVSNTAGTITSTVSANTTSGFSIVTYTGTGANATVGHGLGVAPAMYIVKRRTGGVGNWAVWHTSLSNTTTSYILLDSTAAQSTSTSLWGSTAATSTTLGLGTSVTTNNSTDTYVAYCFSSINSYSSFGSYTGNGSTDGPFVYCGFRPRFVMVKASSAATDWYIYDTARDTYNVATLELNPNLAAAEQNGTYGSMDINSNGFKLRFATGEVNASGATYIYAAFAENPTKYANAR